MAKSNTNFAVLCDLLGISNQEMSIAISADITLISRWRTGTRALVAGRHWVKKITEYMLLVDKKQSSPVVTTVLATMYPTSFPHTDDEVRSVLEQWLCTPLQKDPQYREKRQAQLLEAFAATRSHGENSAAPVTSRSIHGEKAVQQALLDMMDDITAAGKTDELLFVCPSGLSLLTYDEQYGKKLMEKLMAYFQNGGHLKVVLRTDFKMSEVSSFSGPWLVAHLLGYVSSYYYDDFRQLKGESMMAVIHDQLSFEIVHNEPRDYTCTFYYDHATTESIRSKCNSKYDKSIHRFHYEYFQQPDEFLGDVVNMKTGPCYLYTRLPIFSLLGDEKLTKILGSEDEMAMIRREFKPFFVMPEDSPANMPVYHILCEDAITEALDKPRHLSYELSDMVGRRVYLSAQDLVDQLIAIDNNVRARKNYHLCFLSESLYEQLRMQIGVWGSSCAIGWVNGGLSTACKDYTNVGALHGFCSDVWDRIPSLMHMRGSNKKKLQTWLRRAKNFGLDVNVKNT